MRVKSCELEVMSYELRVGSCKFRVSGSRLKGWEQPEVEFCIFNVLGEVVMNLCETKSAGSYTITLDSGELSSGVHFYSLKTEKHYIRNQMMIMK